MQPCLIGSVSCSTLGAAPYAVDATQESSEPRHAFAQGVARAWLAAGSGAKRAENVVMLLADDLGWADVSVPPMKAALWVTETPHLERMAREGLTLTGYRNAASVCSPSRLLSLLVSSRGATASAACSRTASAVCLARPHGAVPAKCGLRDGAFWEVAPRRRLSAARADRAAGRCHRGAGPPGHWSMATTSI